MEDLETDQALYMAKNSARNNVQAYDQAKVGKID